jgi:hypothetical protein
MNYDAFVNAVREMRGYQKAYFKEGRKQSDLIEAKKWEKLVDEFLAGQEGEPAASETEQPTLFE